MDKIISTKNIEKINQSLNLICTENNLAKIDNLVCIIFGSYIINANNPSSDIDIIVVDNSFIGAERFECKLDEIPVHYCLANPNIFKLDGKDRKFGGYFTGKIINPHIFVHGDSKIINLLTIYAGQYISPFAGYVSTLSRYKSFDKYQITAFVFISYLSADPTFDSYFLNYFCSPSFTEVWESLSNETIKMLLISKSIIKVNGGFRFTEKFETYEAFHRERMKVAARHWSYGVYCHNGDYYFPDNIFNKSQNKKENLNKNGNRYKEMINFIELKSGLDNIYI